MRKRRLHMIERSESVFVEISGREEDLPLMNKIIEMVNELLDQRERETDDTKNA